VSKLIAYRLMEPALHLAEPVRLRCIEDRPERLFAELSVHNLDLVLCDQPLSDRVSVRAYSHLLGDSPVAWFGTAALQHLRHDFPRSLDRQPMLLPAGNAELRRAIEDWFGRHRIAPRIAGEFQDSALLMAFGRAGVGIYPAPSVLFAEMASMYESEPIGELDGVRERYYAISVQRRLTHPAVVAISQAARRTFAAVPRRRGG
jgi:LysR family transcriptional activator of nhaA